MRKVAEADGLANAPGHRHARASIRALCARSISFSADVFPGGCLPSLGAILESIGRTTDLRFVHAEDFAPHYAETLRRWRQAFSERLDDVRQLGYSMEFIRLWNYYLCYCEALFEERYVGVLQIQFEKPGVHSDSPRLDRPSPWVSQQNATCAAGVRS